jgi:hypothetical protein
VAQTNGGADREKMTPAYAREGRRLSFHLFIHDWHYCIAWGRTTG